METIAITGTSGFLGSRAVDYFSNKYSVVNVSRSSLDITNEKEVLSYFDRTQPKYVIHSAAISNIEVAEKNSDISDKTNRLAPAYIASACKNIGAKLIFMSSDQVYSGNTERHSLTEDVVLNPQNLYAKQKLQAEKMISEILPNAVSLRLTWMYDTPDSNFFQHKALPALILEAAKTGIPFKVNKNQLRSITYIKNVIENLESCFQLPGGVYNFGSENDTSMYKLCKKASEILGYSEDCIETYEGSEKNILINTSKIQSYGIIFPTAEDGLREAFLS